MTVLHVCVKCFHGQICGEHSDKAESTEWRRIREAERTGIPGDQVIIDGKQVGIVARVPGVRDGYIVYTMYAYGSSLEGRYRHPADASSCAQTFRRPPPSPAAILGLHRHEAYGLTTCKRNH